MRAEILRELNPVRIPRDLEHEGNTFVHQWGPDQLGTGGHMGPGLYLFNCDL